MISSKDSKANGVNGVIEVDSPPVTRPNEAEMVGTAFARRKLKIIMLGAGISGIQFAHDVDTRMDHVELEIFEKNPELGGTYRDSCACDVPAHTYQFSWEPNTRWSKFYAPAPEIRQYLNDVVDKHGLRKYMHFNHRAISARWQEDSSTWRVELETTNSLGDLVVVTRECDVLIKGVGTLNNWKNPDIEGLSTFGGKLMHTANWDETVDLKGKRIAVIGNGASAVQCVAALQPKAERLVNYVRTAAWMIPHLFSDGAVQKDCKPLPYLSNRIVTKADIYTDSAENWEQFEKDPEYYLEYRQQLEKTLASGFQALWSGSPAQVKLEQTTIQHMKETIHDPKLLEMLLPKFEVTNADFNLIDKNSKGKVFIPWPGTMVHYIRTTSLDRWEDFDFDWANAGNKYDSLGNGATGEGFAVDSPPWLRKAT
ncbi:hypothetical protein BKA56DRAFT_622291 [Ilyonectria sp. MPI-CAGE-AT-0026]|nr:hypothetical protein BKA56DRAFT_622291 [Ilyonectria sp. MPI-CAGE-AT-0026]